jgi:hypothetical protein
VPAPSVIAPCAAATGHENILSGRDHNTVTPRHSPPVHMIKLTKEREIAPYVWVHPDDDDRR